MQKKAAGELTNTAILIGLAAPALLGAAGGGIHSMITGPTKHDVDTVEAAIEDKELQEFLTETERKKSLSDKLKELGK